MLIVVPLALLIAQALNTRGLRGRDAFRVVYFTPIVLSPIIIVLIFQLFFDKNFGLLNAILQAVFGLGGIDWLGSPWWARVSVAILIVWRWTGYLVIFFLAGLQGVPRELHEAAEIDGAGPIKRFRHVTLPALQAGDRVRDRHQPGRFGPDLRGALSAHPGRAELRHLDRRASSSTGPRSSGRRSATPPLPASCCSSSSSSSARSPTGCSAWEGAAT